MLILVTGAAGFIGARTVEVLHRKHSVLAVDSFDDYYSPHLKRLRARRVKEATGIEVSRCDLSDPNDCASIFSASIDAVIHLAARPGIRAPVAKLPLYVDSNLVSLANILTNVQAHDIPRLLYASSSSVYGDREGLLSEGQNALEPVSYYGATKLAGELLVNAIARIDDRVFLGLRFFTVYGPWGRPDMLLWKLIASALGGPGVQILGDGSASRDFTYIDDVAQTLATLVSHANLPQGSSVLNVGGGHPFPVNAVIQMLSTHMELNPIVTSGEAISSDVRQTWADTKLLREFVEGFNPMTIEAGLDQTVKWFRSEIARGTDLLTITSEP